MTFFAGPRPLLRRLGPTLAAAILLAAHGAASATAEDSDPAFVASTRDGKTVKGSVRRFDAAGGLVLVDGSKPEVVVPLADLERIVRATPPALPPVEDGAVLLPEGDRLVRAKIGNADDASVYAQTASIGALPIPLEHVVALVPKPPRDPVARAKLFRELRESKATTETLWLANGDKIAGGFTAFTDKSVKMTASTGPVEIDRAGVVALAFDNSLVTYPKPKEGHAEVVFVDGSRVGVRDARIEGGFLMGYARFGPPMKVALAEVAEVLRRSDAVRYLSDDLPLQDRYREFVGPTLPYRRDANVHGRPLRMAGRTYEHGLGTQPRALLAYRVGPDWRRFRATVGLDEDSGPLGHVLFRVVVDGKEAAASPPLTARDKPFELDVPLSGARLIVLITEFGDRGNIQDVADWADARFTK